MGGLFFKKEQMTVIEKHLQEAQELLQTIMSSQEFLLSVQHGSELLARQLQLGKKIMSCGNGGSMCDAMHFAEELSGRYRENRPALAAMSISDPSHMSCVGNDYGYDFVFSRMVEALGQDGDVLVAISTSGNSPNVLKAAEAAKAKGIFVLGLTGKDGGKLGPLCDVEVRVPWNGYADRIQEIHIKVIHSFIDYIETKLT